ncbi:MAG: hypothetical protein KatS3mg129_0909 [Leptospiraceae bacterium]|nr:MAG: hypothetical protein KatS3mg129_0909 [Leptospiraceae bacterium]
MIEWKEEEPDIKVLPWDKFPFDKLKIKTEQFYQYIKDYNYIFFKKEAWENMWNHGKSSYNEVGGLFIGYVYQYNNDFIWYIESIVYNNDLIHSTTHLILFPSLWQKANSLILDNNGNPEKFIIGWYHTHPNFTPFFSITDQNTHKHFFNFDYSLGLVFDPFSERFTIYKGKEMELYKDKIKIIDLF